MCCSPTGSPRMDNIPRAESNIILDSILTYYTNMAETTPDDGSLTPTMPSERQTLDDSKRTSNLMTNPIEIKDIGEFPLPPYANHTESKEIFTAGPLLAASEQSPESTRILLDTLSKRSMARYAQINSSNISIPNMFQPLQLIGSPRFGNPVSSNSKSFHLPSSRQELFPSKDPLPETIGNAEFRHAKQEDEDDCFAGLHDAHGKAGLKEQDWRTQANHSEPTVQLPQNESMHGLESTDHHPLGIHTISSLEGTSSRDLTPSTLQIQLPAMHRVSFRSVDSFWNSELSPESHQRLLGRYSTQSALENDHTGHCLDQLDEALREADWLSSALHSADTSEEQDLEQRLNYTGEIESPSFASCLSAIHDLESGLTTSNGSTNSLHNPLLSYTGSDASEFCDAQGEISWSSRRPSLDAPIPLEMHWIAPNSINMDIPRHKNPQQFPQPLFSGDPEAKFKMRSSIEEEQSYVGSKTEDKTGSVLVNWNQPSLRGALLDVGNNIANESIKTLKRSATQHNNKTTWPLPSGRKGRIDVRQRSNTQPSRPCSRDLDEEAVKLGDRKEKSLPALPHHAMSRGIQALKNSTTSLRPLQDERQAPIAEHSANISMPRPALTRKPIHKAELHKSLPALPEDLDTSAIAASPLSKEVPLPEFFNTTETVTGKTNRAADSSNKILTAEYPLLPPLAHLRDSRFIPHSMEESAATSEEERLPLNSANIDPLAGGIHDAYVIRSYDLEQGSAEPEPLQSTISWGTTHEGPLHEQQTATQQHSQKQKLPRRGCSSIFLHFWQSFSCSASPTRVARTRSPAEAA